MAVVGRIGVLFIVLGRRRTDTVTRRRLKRYRERTARACGVGTPRAVPVPKALDTVTLEARSPKRVTQIVYWIGLSILIYKKKKKTRM